MRSRALARWKAGGHLRGGSILEHLNSEFALRFLRRIPVLDRGAQVR